MKKPYRKYGASKGLPDFIKKRRKKMSDEKEAEPKVEEKKEESKTGKTYDGGPIPKKGSSK